MSVTLERGHGRWSYALIVMGVAGLAATAIAYLNSAGNAPASTAATTPQTPGQAPGKVHVPVFIDPASVRPTPRFRFTFDPPSALADLRSEEKFDEVTRGAREDLDRCVRLMHWVRGQWEPGTPNPYPPINARVILRDIRRGFTGGFCAQYNYVLVQALQSFGVPARYVSLVDHEVIEARLPDRGRWICLDPFYDTLYLDDRGEPLSVLEIHQRAAGGKPVKPSNNRLLPDLPAQLRKFATFAIWLKNDHISSPVNLGDVDRYKVFFNDNPATPLPTPPGALQTSEPADLYPG